MIRLLNTASNLAYAAAGVYVLCGEGLYKWPVGVGLILLSVGSALFHLTDAKWARRCDEAGMYAALTPLMWAALVAGCELAPLAVYVAMGIQFGIMLLFLRWIDSFIAIPVLAVLTFLALVSFGSIRLTIVALGLFAASVGARTLDERGTWKWGHAAWHLGTASAFLVSYLAI